MTTRFRVGRTRWTCRVEVQVIPGFGLGLEGRLHSWRSAYPWLYFGGLLGCVHFGVDLTRPVEFMS